jgi:hypothetical protein
MYWPITAKGSITGHIKKEKDKSRVRTVEKAPGWSIIPQYRAVFHSHNSEN